MIHLPRCHVDPAKLALISAACQAVPSGGLIFYGQVFLSGHASAYSLRRRTDVRPVEYSTVTFYLLPLSVTFTLTLTLPLPLPYLDITFTLTLP